MKGYYAADGDQLPLSTLRMRKEEMGLCVDRGISVRCKELPPARPLPPDPVTERRLSRSRTWGSRSGAVPVPPGLPGAAGAPLGSGRAPVCNAPCSSSLSLGYRLRARRTLCKVVCVKVTYFKRPFSEEGARAGSDKRLPAALYSRSVLTGDCNGTIKGPGKLL